MLWLVCYIAVCFNKLFPILFSALSELVLHHILLVLHSVLSSLSMGMMQENVGRRERGEKQDNDRSGSCALIHQETCSQIWLKAFSRNISSHCMKAWGEQWHWKGNQDLDFGPQIASLFVMIDSTFTIDWLRTRLIPLLIIAFTFVSSQQVSMLSVFFGYPIPFLGSAKSVAEATFRKAFWCLTSGRFFIFIAKMATKSTWSGKWRRGSAPSSQADSQPGLPHFLSPALWHSQIHPERIGWDRTAGGWE